jgi:hypothetical protein
MRHLFHFGYLQVVFPAENSWLAAQLYKGSDETVLNISILSLALYVGLPKMLSGDSYGDKAYGFYTTDEALVLEWNKTRRFIYYPWTFDFHSAHDLVVTRDWVVEVPRSNLNFSTVERFLWVYGEAADSKHVEVTASRTRTRHRRRILKFTSMFEKALDRAHFAFRVCKDGIADEVYEFSTPIGEKQTYISLLNTLADSGYIK